jgi:hypothetical protein
MSNNAWINKNRILINVIGFQVLWWWCVLCGREGADFLAIAVVLIACAAHLRWVESWPDALPILTITLLGCVLDQTMYHFNHVVFAHQESEAQWIPLWMAGLWLGFACTLNVSMRWLQNYWWLALILGAIFGPVAYLGAEKLGAIKLMQGNTTMILLAIGWGFLFPCLLRIRQLAAKG